MASTRTEDVVQRATRLYDEKLRETLEKTNLHEFVAIEPDRPHEFNSGPNPQINHSTNCSPHEYQNNLGCQPSLICKKEPRK